MEVKNRLISSQSMDYRAIYTKLGSMTMARDFLPADIPNTRIMTIGYNSAVAFSKPMAKIEDKALELLNSLIPKRSSPAAGKSIEAGCLYMSQYGRSCGQQSACSFE